MVTNLPALSGNEKGPRESAVEQKHGSQLAIALGDAFVDHVLTNRDMVVVSLDCCVCCACLRGRCELSLLGVFKRVLERLQHPRGGGEAEDVVSHASLTYCLDISVGRRKDVKNTYIAERCSGLGRCASKDAPYYL